jgi:hypothetical protein
MQNDVMPRSGVVNPPATMQNDVMPRSGVVDNDSVSLGRMCEKSLA